MLSSLETASTKSLPLIQDALFESLQQRKYYAQRPDRVKQGYLIGGVVLGMLLTVGLSVVADRWGMAPMTFLWAGLLSGLIVVGFGRIMPARTVERDARWKACWARGIPDPGGRRTDSSGW